MGSCFLLGYGDTLENLSRTGEVEMNLVVSSVGLPARRYLERIRDSVCHRNSDQRIYRRTYTDHDQKSHMKQKAEMRERIMIRQRILQTV